MQPGHRERCRTGGVVPGECPPVRNKKPRSNLRGGADGGGRPPAAAYLPRAAIFSACLTLMAAMSFSCIGRSVLSASTAESRPWPTWRPS